MEKIIIKKTGELNERELWYGKDNDQACDLLMRMHWAIMYMLGEGRVETRYTAGEGWCNEDYCLDGKVVVSLRKEVVK